MGRHTFAISEAGSIWGAIDVRGSHRWSQAQIGQRYRRQYKDLQADRNLIYAAKHNFKSKTTF